MAYKVFSQVTLRLHRHIAPLGIRRVRSVTPLMFVTAFSPNPAAFAADAPASPDVRLAMAAPHKPIEQIVVYGKRILKRHDDAASEGLVTAVQLAQRPIYRIGELLETVPG